MGWPPELDSCPHGRTVGYCDTCASERVVDRVDGLSKINRVARDVKSAGTLKEKLLAGPMTPLRAQFLAFHRENPQVYRKMKEKCQALWDRGWRHFSTRDLLSSLRYDFALETGGEAVEIEGGEVIRVKLNNNHSAYYSRLLAYKVSQFETFFKYRRVEGEDDGQVILFSDIPGERDFVLGHRPTKRRKPRRPPPKRRKR